MHCVNAYCRHSTFTFFHSLQEAVITEGPKLIACHEDDDFVSTLDKLMSEDSTTVGVQERGSGCCHPSAPEGGRSQDNLMVRMDAREYTGALVISF